MKDWFVYILECKDGTFYTGITDDIKDRLTAHNAGAGARYTKGRGPVFLKYQERVRGRSEASKREVKIKKLSREKKKEMIYG